MKKCILNSFEGAYITDKAIRSTKGENLPTGTYPFVNYNKNSIICIPVIKTTSIEII